MSTSKKSAPMAAVGSYEGTLPFKAIGLDVVVVTDENRSSIGQILNKFAMSGYAALFLEETLYAEFQDVVDEVCNSEDISIIPVPGQSGSMGTGLASIRRNVERAVGMDIFGVK